ncbi:MAG: hypothetical protein ACTSR8_04045 [Promethearchaeota archaeon]
MNEYIDIDKNKTVFYYNLYLKDHNCVVKIPIFNRKANRRKDIKVEKFDLTKYTFLLNYEKSDYYLNHIH